FEQAFRQLVCAGWDSHMTIAWARCGGCSCARAELTVSISVEVGDGRAWWWMDARRGGGGRTRASRFATRRVEGDGEVVAPSYLKVERPRDLLRFQRTGFARAVEQSPHIRRSLHRPAALLRFLPAHSRGHRAERFCCTVARFWATLPERLLRLLRLLRTLHRSPLVAIVPTSAL